MQSVCGRHVAVHYFIFPTGWYDYLSHRLVWVCEKELFHMGKNNGNSERINSVLTEYEGRDTG